MSFLPGFIRRSFTRSHRADDLVARLRKLARQVDDTPDLVYPTIQGGCTAVQAVILDGMYTVSAPSTGEALALPIFRQGSLVSDPFYDVDLVEFCLGLPLRHRLIVSPHTKTFVAFGKRILQRLAARHLPESSVKHKDILAVDFEHAMNTHQFVETLPRVLNGTPLNTFNARFRAEILKVWADSLGLSVE